MGYSFIYLFIVLILFMFVLRFFMPILIYLLPVFFIIWIIKAIFGGRHKTKTSTYDQTYYDQQTQQQNHQSSDPNVIDVDYKVVDEQEQDDNLN